MSNKSMTWAQKRYLAKQVPNNEKSVAHVYLIALLVVRYSFCILHRNFIFLLFLDSFLYSLI